MSHKLVIVNTLFDEPPERQITCYNVGAKPGDDIFPNTFGQIDFVLISKDWAHLLLEVYSDRKYGLPSHHFLLSSTLHLDVPKRIC